MTEAARRLDQALPYGRHAGAARLREPAAILMNNCALAMMDQRRPDRLRIKALLAEAERLAVDESTKTTVRANFESFEDGSADVDLGSIKKMLAREQFLAVAEQARRDEDADAAERVSGRALDLEVVLLRRDGSLDVTVFHYFRANADRMSSPNQARVLIDQGEHALMTGDTRTLSEVNQRIRGLLPATMSDPTTGGVRRQRGFSA